MKTWLLVPVLVIALAVTGCGKEEQPAANMTPEQKSFVESAEVQLGKLQAEAKKLIADASKSAEGEAKTALEELDKALKDSEKALADLKSAGEQAWAEKKPVLEAALKDLGAKLGEATAKTKIGEIKLPSFGK